MVSQGGIGGSVQRSESSQDHPDLSHMSSENVSAEQVDIYCYLASQLQYILGICRKTKPLLVKFRNET